MKLNKLLLISNFVVLITLSISITNINGLYINALNMPYASYKEILPYSNITGYRYKEIDGVKYKRLWSYTYSRWEETYWTVA